MNKEDKKKALEQLLQNAEEAAIEPQSAEGGAETEDKKEAAENVKEASDKDASAIEEQTKDFGKFRNPEELMRAYKELEKEFTRRSQRLNKLEAELESAVKPYEPDEEEWKSTVDKFFEKTPAARPFAKDIAVELIRDPSLKSDRNCLNNALVRVLSAKFRTPEQLMEDGEFLNGYVLGSETVKNAVITEYLNGLAKGKPPVTLAGGGERVASLPSKPKSIEEAGVLFLKNNG